MDKQSDHILRYPPNLQELDLATMVSMYRGRGEPRKADPGKYIACTLTGELLKEAKWWFGLYYSQTAWDSLLTKHSNGYPLTETEFDILGLILVSEDEPPHREHIENNVDLLPKMAYLIINDLKNFGFIHENDQGFLMIAPRGEQALQGIARRLYNKRFSPAMLSMYHFPESSEEAKKPSAPDSDQPSLF